MHSAGLILTIGKSLFITWVVLSASNLSLTKGLIPGGKDSHKRRQAIFFTPLNPVGGDPEEEEPPDDYTVPQKVHYHSHWKRNPNAVYKIQDCNWGKQSHTRSSWTIQQHWICWNSTRVSLNCSEVTQGMLRIITVLESCLAASFMNKAKPLLIWEISCSMFCERFQQYRPYGVPMKCCAQIVVHVDRNDTPFL